MVKCYYNFVFRPNNFVFNPKNIIVEIIPLYN